MIDTSLPTPLATDRYSSRRRVSRPAWALAIAIHIIVLLLLAIQKNQPFVRMSEQSLHTFLLPEANDGTDESKAEKTPQKKKETAKRKEEETPPPPAAVQPPPPPPVIKDAQMPFIVMSRQDLAASDISRMTSQRRASTGEAQGDSKAPFGPGAAPGGGSLYPADWYREPTNAELQGYIRPTQPARGWGQVACKTVERYHVDECYILGESPMGSGYGRSVLNAAWQFMVRPPQVNGRSQVGTWVSIRITYGPEGSDVSQGR